MGQDAWVPSLKVCDVVHGDMVWCDVVAMWRGVVVMWRGVIWFGGDVVVMCCGTVRTCDAI